MGSKVNVKTETNDQTTQGPTEVNKTPTTGKDLSWGEIELLKIQNRDQSKRIDELEQRLAMLQNAPPASSNLATVNNKDRMNNGASNSIDGKVSKASTPPSSCQDLAMLDYHLDGLYLVKNQQTQRIQTVFCKFSADNKGRMNSFLSQTQKLFFF